MVARVRVLEPPRAPGQVLRRRVSWPASRLNGTSPIRLLAAVTLVILGIALSASRGAAAELGSGPAGACAGAELAGTLAP
jgi:hypothetical protein